MSVFPDELRSGEPQRTADFCVRLGYNTANVAGILMQRFGFASEAQRIAATSGAPVRAELDRAALRAEHDLDS